MCLEPKAKTSLRALQIQYPVKRSESPSQGFEFRFQKVCSNKDLNLQDKGSESLKRKKCRLWRKCQGIQIFERMIRISKKIFEKESWKDEKDSNLYNENLNPSFAKMKNKAKNSNLRKKDSNPFIRR